VCERFYDSLVAVPITETAGIVVVALRNDGSHDPYPLIEAIETEAS